MIVIVLIYCFGVICHSVTNNCNSYVQLSLRWVQFDYYSFIVSLKPASMSPQSLFFFLKFVWTLVDLLLSHVNFNILFLYF